MLPVLALPFLFTACEKDVESNPILDISHAVDGFVLNVPANAENNVYDLASAQNVELTTNQPNYGGVPYVTRYYVQVAIDEAFLNDTTVAHKELLGSYTSAKMKVDATELNDSIVKLFQEANPDTDYPETERPVYIRLRAVIDNTNSGLAYSNIITLPHVLATYVAPPAKLPTELFVIGGDIQEGWSSWKPMAPVYGVEGNFYTMVHLSANGEFKWGTYNGDWRGYDRIKEIINRTDAEVSEGDMSNIKVSKEGWYVLLFNAEVVGSSVQYTLTIANGEAYVCGNPTGIWGVDEKFAMKPNKDGIWVSPAFPNGGELRAFISVPGFDWWRTEFTLFKGDLYWRTVDIPNNWAENVGAAYSVACESGQKLYVDFNYNTGEVKK